MSRFIHYSEENQEPEDHISGKERVRGVLEGSGFILVTNTEKFEYKLPTLYNDIGDMKREYTLDVLMFNPATKLMIIVEVQGGYHYGNHNTPKYTSKKKEADMRLKQEIVSNYFSRGGIIIVNKYRYHYNSFRYFSIKTKDLMMLSIQNLRKYLLG